MNLYERDYSISTKEEDILREEVIARNTVSLGRIKPKNSKYFFEQPKVFRHKESLFPNNYLDIVELYEYEKLSKINQAFNETLENTKTTESDIQRFIKSNKAYHLIGSLLKLYNFGHHSAYLFPEFQLGTSFKADYLLVGKSSDGFSFVFVELESPYGNIFMKNGDFGESARKGINQIEDWKSFIQRDFSTISSELKKYTKAQLTDEFYNYDATRCNYVVVVGRRKDFNDKSYELSRKKSKESNIIVTHYDKIYDLSENLIINGSGALTY